MRCIHVNSAVLYIQAFDGSLTWLELMQPWFVGVLVAYINYVYAELFYAKWMERCALIQVPEATVKMEAAMIDSAQRVVELQAQVDQARAELQQTGPELKELRALRKQLDADRTCPHCNQVQSNANTLRSHKGHCPKNPIKQLTSTN